MNQCGCAPIALFVYNRTSHTAQTLVALSRNELAEKSDLIIFSDAPKSPEHAKAVSEVRKLIKEVRGFRSVRIVEREENYGLARSIINGVTELVSQYGRIIVLEDDLVTSPHFLGFMNAGLDRYADEIQVMQVAGYMFPVDLEASEDSLFLPFSTSWGWATWERAWNLFDPHCEGYKVLKNDPALKKRFDLNDSYPYFNMLRAQIEGEIDSWAIRWYLSMFMHDGIAIYPKHTLVGNTGFDGSGTHCGDVHTEQMNLADSAPSRFPHQTIVDNENRDVVFEFLAKRNRQSPFGLVSRCWRFLKKKFGR